MDESRFLAAGAFVDTFVSHDLSYFILLFDLSSILFKTSSSRCAIIIYRIFSSINVRRRSVKCHAPILMKHFLFAQQPKIKETYFLAAVTPSLRAEIVL